MLTYEQVGKELKALLTFWYHEDVRSSAMSAMPLMCRSAAAFVRNNKADASIVQQVLTRMRSVSVAHA